MTAIPRASPASFVGRVIAARFEIFEYVGSGSLTHVFRAWDQRLQHIVAIKLLIARYAGDPVVAAAFEGAALRAAGLPRHPAIVPVYEVGRDGDLIYAVTEFVPGRNLRQVIVSDAPLEANRAFRICRQVARALDVAHQYGIDHQNINLSHIILLPRDEVRVTDFGFAGVARAADLASTQVLEPDAPLLSSGPTAGQASGQVRDVHALGAVLWEMLTASPPAGGYGAIRGTMQRQQDLRQINPTVSPAAAAIVLRALAPAGERRYQSASALAAALQQYLANEKGDTLTEFVSGPVVPDSEATVHASLSNGSKPVAPQKVQQKPPTRPPFAGRPTSRWRPSWGTLVFLLVIGLAAAGGWFAYQRIWNALNGSSSGSHSPAVTRGNRAHATAGRSQQTRRHAVRTRRAPVHAAALNPNLIGSPNCSNQGFGVIHLPSIWAEETHPLPGQGVRFDYTISNSGSQCQNVRLGVAMVSPAHPGVPLADPARDRVVAVVPGTNMYRRRFRFTQSTAGRTFDAVLTVSDPAGRQVYAQIRVPHLIAVAP